MVFRKICYVALENGEKYGYGCSLGRHKYKEHGIDSLPKCDRCGSDFASQKSLTNIKLDSYPPG